MSHDLLLKDLSQALDGIISDMVTFLRKSVNRTFSDKQIHMIMLGQYEQLRDAYNKVVLNSEITINERTTLLFEIIPKLHDLINTLNHYSVPKDINLRIENILNLAIAGLVGPSGDDSIWFQIASANLLIRILTGIRTFDTMPKLFYPPAKDFWENNALIMNSLRGIILVHSGVIVSLSHVNLEKIKCIEWANISFQHLKYIYDYYDDINLLAYVTALKGKEQNIYYGALLRHLAINWILSTGFILQRLFGEVWPHEINTFGLLPKKSLRGLVEFCASEEKKITYVLQTIKDLYSKGIIDVNEPPDKYPYFENLEQLKISYNVIPDILLALEESLKFNLHYQDHLPIELINQGIESAKFYRTYLAKYGNGYDSIFIQFLNYEISLVFTKSLYLKDLQIFKDYITGISNVFDNFQKNSYPELLYTILLAEISLICELSNKHELIEKLESIPGLLNSLQKSPRMYVTVLLLNTILLAIVDKYDQSSFLIDIEKSKNILQTFGQVHLESRFSVYSNHLQKALNSSQNHQLTENLASLKIADNALDIFSWLKPNFTKLFNQPNSQPIIWFPFNLECYALLD